RRGGHFQHSLLWCWKKHLEGFNFRRKSPRFELGQDPLGVLLVVGRAHMVWPRRQSLHGIAHDRRVGQRAEFVLPIALRGRAGSGETVQRFVLIVRLVVGRRKPHQNKNAKQDGKEGASHQGLLERVWIASKRLYMRAARRSAIGKSKTSSLITWIPLMRTQPCAVTG